jgi:membrane-bound ClpP family serine protease
MMEWAIVITLVVFGLALIVAEIIFVPGTTVVGFLGFAFLVVGAGMSFRYFGGTAGWITVGATAIASGFVFYFSFKANVWGRFALKSSVDSKVNEGEVAGLTAGQEGIALSALRPVGKGEWDNKTYEVKTQGEYVERGTKIRIIKISLNQIIVEPTS